MQREECQREREERQREDERKKEEEEQDELRRVAAFQRELEQQDRKDRSVREEHERRMEILRLEAELKQPRNDDRSGMSQCASTEALSAWLDGSERAWRRVPPKLPVPKYDEKTQIAEYLELFESVMYQNRYAEDAWGLALRTAGAGTNISPVISKGGAYKDMKAELLIAFGQKPEEVWTELMSAQQL